jgi:hypothetical protein
VRAVPTPDIPMKLPAHAVPALMLIVLAQLAGCSRPPITAAQLVSEMNKRTTLPLDLGDGFRLDAITAEGNTVVSTVTMSDASLASDPRFKEVMRSATVSDICREITPAKQAYTDAGLSIAKIYRDSKGTELLRVDVRPAECV